MRHLIFFSLGLAISTLACSSNNDPSSQSPAAGHNTGGSSSGGEAKPPSMDKPGSGGAPGQEPGSGGSGNVGGMGGMMSCAIACGETAPCEAVPGVQVSCVNPDTCEAECSESECSILCTSDSECDDADAGTRDVCADAGTCGASCQNPACSSACSADSDCDDGNADTEDSCLDPGTCDSTCAHNVCERACASSKDCDDGNSLTEDECVDSGDACLARCVYGQPCTPTCSADSQCDDGNPATTDTCRNAGRCNALCSNVKTGCSIDSECDDGDVCTTDSCASPSCVHDNACPDGDCVGELSLCPDDAGYRQPRFRAAITQQINDPDKNQLTVELLTLSTAPYAFGTSSISSPSGMKLVSLTTTSCGVSSSVKCRHKAVFSYGTACFGSGLYTWRLNYTCAAGTDCDLMDPSHTSENITTQLTTERLCE